MYQCASSLGIETAWTRPSEQKVKQRICLFDKQQVSPLAAANPGFRGGGIRQSIIRAFSLRTA